VSPEIAARSLCDKHVVKMTLETAQLLSTAHRIVDGDESGRLSGDMETRLYHRTHVGHPCVRWSISSIENYLWLAEHFVYLCSEYRYRYGRIHKSFSIVDYLVNPPVGISAFKFTKPALCMPDEYKVTDHVESYRNYYRIAKKSLHKYTNRHAPDWLYIDNTKENQI
jgi:hypothetical protein